MRYGEPGREARYIARYGVARVDGMVLCRYVLLSAMMGDQVQMDGKDQGANASAPDRPAGLPRNVRGNFLWERFKEQFIGRLVIAGICLFVVFILDGGKARYVLVVPVVVAAIAIFLLWARSVKRRL